MEGSIEQRYAIKFCVRLGKNATETYSMLRESFKDDCISRSQSGPWNKAFLEGPTEVADEQLSERPITARTDANVERVQKLLDTDHRLGIRQIADTLDISTFAVHGIITQDLAMRKVCAKLIPKVLTQEQKDLRVLRCQELFELIESPYLAPCDFFLFLRLKQDLKGHRWGTLDNVKAHVTSFLKAIPAEEFAAAFEAWKSRLHKCISSKGHYFEDF
ncbi:protein GVQW3-like [Belonocnema kinseyi]|uniref:protein GVQW3-like n=1 Tax=Belonocnema kinseyi TaxID=2817044 RepID=UPI00143D3A4C|nr:protein GVQW3-like [Belonocnema kinseyi]